MIFNPTAKNLFDEDDDEILQNIEILTGIRLKEDPNMPKHICTCCHLDLYYSMAFRERCLRAENFLHREREQQKVKQQDTLTLCGSVTKEFGISEILNMSARSATSSLRLVQCGLSTKARPKNSLSYTATPKERK
ncbi:hypothetical protein ACLKA6_005157 [Drosophila palustris]